MMKHQRVPVGIAEERHVAHARVEDVAVERDPRRLELGAGSRNVVHVQRERVRCRLERHAEALGLPDVERDLARGDLEPGRRLRLERKAERVDVEAP